MGGNGENEGDPETMLWGRGVGHGLPKLNGEAGVRGVGAGEERRNPTQWLELGAAVLEGSLQPECLPWNFPA